MGSGKSTGGIPGIDRECVALCDAINRIPGIKTTESCCGHGDREFAVYFRVKSLARLPVLLYHIDPCHVKITRWDCRVTTDCAMSPVSFHIRSRTTGKEAYREAIAIAREINAYLDGAESAKALIPGKARRGTRAADAGA